MHFVFDLWLLNASLVSYRVLAVAGMALPDLLPVDKQPKNHLPSCQHDKDTPVTTCTARQQKHTIVPKFKLQPELHVLLTSKLAQLSFNILEAQRGPAD